MKKLLTLLAFGLLPFFQFAQINMDSLGYLDLATIHSTEMNDIWGYTDENGNEYAIVGTNDGTSIVDVTDPTNPTEIVWIPGMNSIWRDMKVYDDYAYITTEATEGLLIIDMSPLPGSTVLPTSYYTGPVTDQWEAAHNLYEADGYLYIFGANRGNKGVIILDVATDPLNPIEVGVFDNWYCHDGFVRNDTGYFSHVSDGFFTIVDLADKANLGLGDIIGTLATSSNFTHNCWTSDDGQTLFTTDEVSDGYIDSYDISDPTNPLLLDQIQSSPGNNIIPHNVHVLNNYLVTSYYTDGVVVHDISDPANMVEIANWDTSPAYSGGTFNGCWGVYPFFPSQNIIAADIELGLFVLGLNPTLSSYLQGNITSFGTGLPINNALIEILTTPTTDNSDVLGDYSIGTTQEALLEVRYSAPGYYADTFDINFVNGTIITQDVALVQVPLFNATITVIDNQTSLPVENANVLVEHTLQNFEGLTDVNGEVTFGLFYEDNYNITAGQWLYINDCDAGQSLTITNNTHEMQLDSGIYDDFTFDFGWTTFGGASAGHWVREVPVGTQSSGQTANPYSDVFFDCSTFAYTTGNGASTVGGDDVDGGSVELKSPVIDLSSYMNPEIKFSYWFFNGFGGGNPNDSLAIYMSNGTGAVAQIASLGIGTSLISVWSDITIKVTDYMANTNTMQLTFLATDYAPGHVLKAGVDYLRVTETSLASTGTFFYTDVEIYPNPADQVINIQGIENGLVQVFDLSGRKVIEASVNETIDVSTLKDGMYVIKVTDVTGTVVKIQKQEIR